MSNFKLIFLFIISLSIFPQINVFSQDIDIVTYLKQIEDGNKAKVVEELPLLKKNNPGSLSLIFLEGVLTDDGQQAVSLYTYLLKKFPKSKYADAALYRICSYYYAIGKYTAVKSNLSRLKKEYPQSPYIKLAQRELPARDLVNGENETDIDKNVTTKLNKSEDTKSYKYTIQAGAFTVADNANSLKSDLDSAGYFTKVEDKNVAGTSFRIIYVGKFVNQEDAKNFLKLVNSKFNLNGRVVSINSK